MTRPNCKLILLSIGLIILNLVSVAGKGYADVPNAPSDVYIDQGTNILMVQKPNDTARPFVIKGVSWSPATRAPAQGPNPLDPTGTVPYGFFFDWDGRYPPGYEVLNYWLKNELINSEHYLIDIPLIKQMNANTVRIYHSLGSSLEDYTVVKSQLMPLLDTSYNNGIMVIMSVAMSKKDLDSQKYLTVVSSFKDHPAILMWAIGNEWNLNGFYDTWAMTEAAQAVEQAAIRIKELDVHHPVCSILGDAFESGWKIGDILPQCLSIDLWGLNIYRGMSFGNLFEQWKAAWEAMPKPAKPFYISEFGTDSFYTTSYVPIVIQDGPTQADNTVGYNDEQKQTDYVLALWREIKAHLSLDVPGEFCLGGLIHEFNDELWKVGSYHVELGGLLYYNNPPESHSYDDYNSEGFVLDGSSPDNVLNEEYFGLVTADRQPKMTYVQMKQEWADTTPPTTPLVSDSGTYTNSTTTLSASWISEDPESGIAEYQYRIAADAQSTRVVRDWTSTGTDTSVVATGLRLSNGKRYYFFVKARNGAGLWSEVGRSDGITVDITLPLVINLTRNLQPRNRSVLFRAKVIDTISGVNSVSITIDNITKIYMHYNPKTRLYEATFNPKDAQSRLLRYSLAAQDNATNTVTLRGRIILSYGRLSIETSNF